MTTLILENALPGRAMSQLRQGILFAGLLLAFVAGSVHSAAAQVTIEPLPYFAESSGELVIYPNPATTNMTVASPRGVDILSIQVRNMSSHLIFQGDYEEGQSWYVASMTTGYYYLIVTTSEGVETHLVEVQSS